MIRFWVCVHSKKSMIPAIREISKTEKKKTIVTNTIIFHHHLRQTERISLGINGGLSLWKRRVLMSFASTSPTSSHPPSLNPSGIMRKLFLLEMLSTLFNIQTQTKSKHTQIGESTLLSSPPRRPLALAMGMNRRVKPNSL